MRPRARRFQLAMVALLITLAAPLCLTPPTVAQLPTPVLDTGAGGDGTTAPPMPVASYPILIALAVIGGGLGLLAVTAIRRWDRDHYPDSDMHTHRHGPYTRR